MLLLLNVSCLFTQQKEIYIGLLKGLIEGKMCILLILCLEERIMSVTIVEGSQWGDEGKGKITDYLAQQSSRAEACLLEFSTRMLPTSSLTESY